MPYFTERHFGPKPRVNETLTEATRTGIVGLIRSKIDDGSFGLSYPEQCPDGNAVVGTHYQRMREALAAYALYSPLDATEPPSDPELFDLIEFTVEKIGKPIASSHHGFFRHDHLDFDRDLGEKEFREEINKIFERNGIAFELKETGEVSRIAPEILRGDLQQALFRTGDQIADELLESARVKFLSRDPAVRRESLEKLWDAWERLKTLEAPHDKQASVGVLLDRSATSPSFRALLEAEARALTDIGNSYLIRHAEVGKVPIDDSEQVDYLFHRLFSLIRMLLRKTNRGG